MPQAELEIVLTDIRQQQHCKQGISQLAATAQFLNIMMGVGLLTIPAAFRSMGLVLGAISLLFVAFITYSCLAAFSTISNYVRVHDGVENRAFYQLAQTVMETVYPHYRFPAIFSALVFLLLELNLFANMVLYITMVSGSLQEVLFSITGRLVDVHFVTASIMPPLTLLCSIRKLPKLTPFVALGNLLILLGSCAILINVAGQLIKQGVHNSVILAHSPPEVRTFLTVVVFTFGAITAMPSIENIMATPRKMYGFPSVAASTIIVMALGATISGGLGYLTYGSTTKPRLDYHLTRGSAISILLHILVATGISLSIPLLFNVMLEQVQTWCNKCTSWKCEVLLRYSLLLLTFILPLISNDVAQVMEIMSPALALLQFVVPAVMFIAFFWKSWSINTRIFRTIWAGVQIAYGTTTFYLGIEAYFVRLSV